MSEHDVMWGEEEEEGGNFLHGFILGYIWVVIEAHNQSVALLSLLCWDQDSHQIASMGGERTLLYAALGKRNVAGEEKDVAASEP